MSDPEIIEKNIPDVPSGLPYTPAQMLPVTCYVLYLTYHWMLRSSPIS